MSKAVTIPTDLVPEFEAWGRATAELFGKLRSRAGMKPKHVPADQAWFWSETWQEKERAADAAEARGEYDDFDSAEALIADLHKHV
jgi:hypothetical protein